MWGAKYQMHKNKSTIGKHIIGIDKYVRDHYVQVKHLVMLSNFDYNLINGGMHVWSYPSRSGTDCGVFQGQGSQTDPSFSQPGWLRGTVSRTGSGWTKRSGYGFRNWSFQIYCQQEIAPGCRAGFDWFYRLRIQYILKSENKQRMFRLRHQRYLRLIFLSGHKTADGDMLI